MLSKTMEQIQTLAGFTLFLWYVVGLAVMIKHGFIWWTIVGVVIPIIPMIYLLVRFVNQVPWL